MRYLRNISLGVLAVTMFSSSVSAQRRPRQANQPARAWELGMDAALSLGLDDPNVTVLQVPVANFRAGTLINDVFAVEPFFSLQTISGGGNTLTTYQLGVGGLYHFSTNRARSQVYVRPFVGIVGINTDAAGGDNSDVAVGVGAGMKWPKLGGRIAWRGEANFSAVGDQTALNFLWGLSYFTR
jgi:hypothetical protein